MKAKQILQRGVHIGFGQQTVFECLRQIGFVLIKKSIDAGLDRCRGAVFFVRKALVVGNQQSKRAPVGADEAVVAPFD